MKKAMKMMHITIVCCSRNYIEFCDSFESSLLTGVCTVTSVLLGLRR